MENVKKWHWVGTLIYDYIEVIELNLAQWRTNTKRSEIHTSSTVINFTGAGDVYNSRGLIIPTILRILTYSILEVNDTTSRMSFTFVMNAYSCVKPMTNLISIKMNSIQII